MSTVTLEDVLELDVSDRLQLVQGIWDSIAQRPEDVPVTEAQKQELDRRLAAYRADPNRVEPWEDVRAELSKDE